MAAGDADRLSSLIELARDRAGESRRVLFENISDLFMSKEGRLSERERVLMRDILGRLIGEIEMAVRRSLAERLANRDEAPSELVTLLANDEINVARPILLRSRVLHDPDLIEIVRHRTQEHRLAIAMRAGLTTSVTDALIERGEEDVVASLIENHDAELSRLGMEYLVEQSRRIDRFQEPLLRRPDLPGTLAHRMFWWISAALRQYVLENFAIEQSDLDAELEAATIAAISGSETETPERTKAEGLVDELWQKGRLDENFLLKSLRDGQIPVFVAGLARLLDLDLRTARFIVFDPVGDGLAVAAKAADIGRSSFASIYLLTRGAQEGEQADAAADPDKLDRILVFYDELQAEAAQIALRYWRRDSRYLRSIEALRHGESGEIAPSLTAS